MVKSEHVSRFISVGARKVFLVSLPVVAEIIIALGGICQNDGRISNLAHNQLFLDGQHVLQITLIHRFR